MKQKQIVSFALGPIASAAIGFITLPLISWLFSAEDIGRISMLQVAASLCILVFSLGLDQAYVREYHETKHKPGLLKAAMVPGLLLIIPILTLCILIPGVLSKVLFAVDNAPVSILIALFILSTYISRFLSLVLRMQEKGLAFSMSQILPRLLLLLVIGFYVLLSSSFDLLHLMIANTVSIITVTVIYGWNTRKEWIETIGRKIDVAQLKSMLMFGMPLVAGGFASWGFMTMDRLFLRSTSTFGELGLYSVSTSLAGIALIFQSVFSTVWAPVVYKWAAAGINPQKVDQITEHVLAIVVFVFSLAGLFSWLVTYILPETYDKVQYIVVACMGYPLFYTLSETTVVGLGITRKSIYAMFSSNITLVASFVGCYFLVPIYGASGAAVSTATAFWILLFCRTEFSSKVWRPLPRKKLYISTLVCLILASAFSLTGAEYYKYFIALWLILLVCATLIFKKSIKSGILQLSEWYYLGRHKIHEFRSPGDI